MAVSKVKEHKRELGIVRKANVAIKVAIKEFMTADKTLTVLRKAKDSRGCEIHALKEKQEKTETEVHWHLAHARNRVVSVTFVCAPVHMVFTA